MRDGSVTDQIVTPENNRAPEIGAEDEAAVGPLKETLFLFGRERLGRGVGIASLPGYRKRLVVHVGRINFNSFTESLFSHGFSKSNRQTVGLFSRGTAGAPDSNRGAVLFRREN